jgi:hypothetical protein
MSTEWTVPEPPPERGRIRTRQVWVGIGLAMVGHLVTIGVVLVAVAVSRDTSELPGLEGLLAGLVAQAVLFVVCMITGGVLVARGDRGIGVGVIIGWAVGVLVAPVIGFGICVAAMRQP